MSHPADRLLILDFGSQYSQLIGRRVREIGVYCELFPYFADEQRIRDFAPRGIILSGGPESVTAHKSPEIPAVVWELGVPVLGICYGMQGMAQYFGGQVQSSDLKEFGHTLVQLQAGEHLLSGLQGGKDQIDVWMSHGDKVLACPPGFEVIASNENTPIVAMANTEKHYYGVQFHPEVTHTAEGEIILKRFAMDIVGCQGGWTPENIIDTAVETIREQVGEGNVILGLSGGVDSSVAAALLHRAIGDQLTCVFVDNGLLRLNEGDQVMAVFAEHLGVKVIRVNAQQRFMDALAGVEDPEAKRKVIGSVFIDVFQEQAEQLQDVKFLAQGTIYPDVIESALATSSDGTAHVIKSHHNVGGLPEHLHLKLVEPLRDLFKDEVRRLGIALGLPAEMIYRHPFPGPGLGVRILGEVKPEYAEILQKADAIFIEELRNQGFYDQVSQAFAVFLPVKSVGVVGDARCYDYVIALRSVDTIDFMTAKWSDFPTAFLSHVSGRIMNEVSGVSRVVYDISSKPPSTIEWE